MPKKRRKRLNPRVKVWLEVGGKPVFGDGKLTWLERIAETGSMREAARRLGMSYRGLWGRLRTMEERLGVQLVTRRTGGAGGGGMELTDDAKALVADYHRFRRTIDAYVAKRFERFMR